MSTQKGPEKDDDSSETVATEANTSAPSTDMSACEQPAPSGDTATVLAAVPGAVRVEGFQNIDEVQWDSSAGERESAGGAEEERAEARTAAEEEKYKTRRTEEENRIDEPQQMEGRMAEHEEEEQVKMPQKRITEREKERLKKIALDKQRKEEALRKAEEEEAQRLREREEKERVRQEEIERNTDFLYRFSLLTCCEIVRARKQFWFARG